MTAPAWITDEARDLFFRYDAALPLEARVVERPVGDGVRHLQFRVTSIRGEQVPGDLWLPPESVPVPAVVVQHGAGAGKSDPLVVGLAERWVRQGAAVLAIDAHGHGERATEHTAPGRTPPLPWARLTHATQIAVDLMRAVDFLVTRPEINSEQIGFVGFDNGAFGGVRCVALDLRIRTAVFCNGGAAFPLPAGVDAADWGTVSALIDPRYFAPRIAPRPVLMINSRREDMMVSDQVRALFDAVGEPKEIVWYDGDRATFPGELLERMWEFLRAHLTPKQNVDRG